MNNFDDAARLLAQPLGDLLLALPEQTKEEITELRVRRGRPLVWLCWAVGLASLPMVVS